MDAFHQKLLAFFAEGDEHMVLGPIRRVRENPVSVTARLASSKLGRTVHAESLLEYDFLNILDFDPRVEKYGEQCLAIPWRDGNGRPRKYHPDVLVKFYRNVLERIDGYGGDPNVRFRSTIYEVKPSEVLRADWRELKPKYQGALRALRGTGVRFRLITEKQIRPVFAHNVRLLLGYKVDQANRTAHSSEDAMDEELGQLLRVLKEPITPQEILDRFGQSFELRARLLARLWRMLAKCMFDADLTEPLTMSTPIWPGQLYTYPGQFPTPRWRLPQHDWYR